MATTNKNVRLLEGLYNLGYPPQLLKELVGQTNLHPDSFKAMAQARGVNPADWSKVTKLVEFRKGGKPSKTALYEMMGIMGVSPQTQKAIQYAKDDPDSVLRALTQELGPERAGALMIKAYPGKVPQGTVWNPFRGDEPPKGADLRHGQKVGAFDWKPESFQELPQGPTPQQAKKMSEANRAANLGSRIVGDTGAGGPGAGGPGADKIPPPGGAPPPKLPKTEAEVRAYIEENYSQWAYLQDIPEVWDRVKEAAKGGWSDDRVLGALQKTQWWQKTEASARLWKEERYQDPATAQDKVNKKATELKNAAVAAGITVPDNELASLAEDALRFDWDPNETKAALGRFFRYDKEKLMGAALVTQQTLNQKARDWLVPMDDGTMQKWVTQVVNGEVDAEYFDGYMRDQAKSLFPQLQDPISRGIPPGRWMQPYVSVAAQTLGMNPDQIDLRESKWMRSINQVDDKGARTAMNLADWEDLLKTDDTYGWDKTDKGREHGATMARKVAAMFRGNA